jgi:rhodanese-related sulfurtransferase
MLKRFSSSTPQIPEIDAVAAARAQAADPQLQLIDVREPDEWAEGHIDGATHIPLGDLPARTGELDPDRATVIVCRSGARSGNATMYLMQYGFRDVANLGGGMLAWERAGLPVARDGEAAR